MQWWWRERGNWEHCRGNGEEMNHRDRHPDLRQSPYGDYMFDWTQVRAYLVDSGLNVWEESYETWMSVRASCWCFWKWAEGVIRERGMSMEGRQVEHGDGALIKEELWAWRQPDVGWRPKLAKKLEIGTHTNAGGNTENLKSSPYGFNTQATKVWQPAP